MRTLPTTTHVLRRLVRCLIITVLLCSDAIAEPVAGHYPPGQSGVRGASTPNAGFSITNFNRLFSNIEGVDAKQLRYANITMFTLTTSWHLWRLRYGALAGIPFATGDLSSPTAEQGFGLGDILVTPLSLYGKTGNFDYQFQFTVWTPSGHFSPGSTRNRGTGFWALVYSIGGVYYPGEWSISTVARFEQNFEQRGTAIQPGDDVVIDWGIARTLAQFEIGASGFGQWQLTDQGGEPQRYRLLGVGPEASVALAKPLTLRVRAHFEFAARSIVSGNNLWLIANYRF